MNENELIQPKVRDAIVQSLRGGAVPRVGQKHIQVGRAPQVKALIEDVERIADGGSIIRFIVGEWGSGKTFFLNLVRAIALERKLVTAHADLTPDRRLQSTGGHARMLYRELMKNLSTRNKPDGEALSSVVERFVNSSLEEAGKAGVPPSEVIRHRLQVLSEMVGGYEFADVIVAYWKGHDDGNSEMKANAVRWLRGEFSTRTEAREALGVRTIIDDENIYDHLKLLARFVRLAGYGGLLVALDEMVNIYKLANPQARNSNYEKVLAIVNDCLQGSAEGLGFLFGGTPEFLTDTRRGLFSYPALQTRLAENRFAQDGLVDYSSPVIRLSNLTPEDVFVLLGKLRHVFAGGDPSKYLLPDDGLKTFIEYCATKIGHAYYRTPRNTIKAFLDLLAVLEQNPQAKWTDLIQAVSITVETNPDSAPLTGGADDELAAFKL